MKNCLEISYAEFVTLADLLARERRRETEAGLLALVHAVTNRLVFGEHFSNIMEDPDFSAGHVPANGGPMFDAPANLETVSLLASVLSGASDDLTEGALRFHRHDVCPQWSRSSEPKALIGGRFYYS